jgi:tetratricopeptide (TPR) repeat protein
MPSGIFRKSVATLSAALGLGVQAASPGSGFEARFAPLYASVFQEGASFSGSAMSADLRALEPLVRNPGGAARDIFRLYYTEATVYGRRSMPEQAAKAAQTALAAMPAPADPQLAYAHFFLRYSSIRWLADARQYDAALAMVRSFQAQYPLQQIARLPAEMRWDESHSVPQARDFPSQLQILGVYEDEGYVLHEQGKYREARQANERLLPVSRERLKALDKMERMRGVLTNVAQNCYELGEFAQARTYLQERLQIALAAQDHATIYDSYFQLMVLAHEQGQPQQARQWLASYEQHAKAQKDSEQLVRVKALRNELGSRESGRPSP